LSAFFEGAGDRFQGGSIGRFAEENPSQPSGREPYISADELCRNPIALST
jgi:hypothetical protein